MNKTMFGLWREVRDDRELVFSDWCEFRSFAEATGVQPKDGVDGVRAALAQTEEPKELLSEMSVAELRKLAEEKGIELGDAKKKADIIRVIEEELNNECD